MLSERLPDIPSRLSLIRHLSNPNFYTMPSIMINSETVALKNENNSNASFESSVMVMEIQNCKDLIKPRTNTPHSLQDIESDTEKEKKKNKPQIFSNELLAAKKETGKAKKNNNYKSSKFVKPNIKINLEIKQSSKRKETQNIKFNRVGSISLNSSIMKKKSLPMKLSQKNSNLNLKNNKKEQEELFSQSRNSETNFFPYELVLDFKKKNPLYNKKFDNLFQSKKTQSRRVEGFKSSHNKVKLTFYSFVEKVKRFFDKNYFNSSIDYHYFPLSSSLPQRSEKAVKETPIFEEQNFSVGKVHKLDTSFGRLSQSHSKNINNNTESNSLSPAWKRNSKNFNQNEIQIPTKNFSKSSKNLGLKFSHSQSPKNIPEFAETVKDKNEEYEDVFEDIVKRIDLKMKEHDDIISTNYIYHNQKNIKTIIIEDFFIYLENMTASNYFFYQSFNPSDQNFRFKLNIFKKILPYHMRSKSISIKNFDKPQTEKYYSILKKQTDFEDTIYTVGEEAAITFQDYLNHSDFKNLQMVIDEEMDESFIDDQFSPLFEKLPMNFDFNEKKRNSLNSNNSLSPKFKSKYLSASTPTNYENRNIFYRDEEEYFYDSNDMLNKKIKDKIFLEYFFDIQKKVRYFLVYVLNDVVCFITRLDLNLVNMKLMKEELKINPNNFIKLDEENEKSI